MFGYVRPYAPDLLVRDHQLYRSIYCGLCRTMKHRTGCLSHMLLSYDIVFLALVRMLYEPQLVTHISRRRCGAHPLRRRPMMDTNPSLEYSAHIAAILSYYKLRDEQSDSRGLRRLLSGMGAALFSGRRSRKLYPELDAVIHNKLLALSELERSGHTSPEEPASLFGELLGEIFAHGIEGEGHSAAYDLGHSLGRFIYCADAADDYEGDRESGSYNPYVLSYCGEPMTEDRLVQLRRVLTLMLTDVEEAVKLLPTADMTAADNIIQNILYAGLPQRIARVGQGKRKEKHTDEEPI